EELERPAPEWPALERSGPDRSEKGRLGLVRGALGRLGLGRSDSWIGSMCRRDGVFGPRFTISSASRRGVAERSTGGRFEGGHFRASGFFHADLAGKLRPADGLSL